MIEETDVILSGGRNSVMSNTTSQISSLNRIQPIEMVRTAYLSYFDYFDYSKRSKLLIMDQKTVKSQVNGVRIQILTTIR